MTYVLTTQSAIPAGSLAATPQPIIDAEGGLRVLGAVSVWAFGTGFHRLHLDHSFRNAASCRVAEKAGFVLEGTKRSAAIHADGRHDMHLHAWVI